MHLYHPCMAKLDAGSYCFYEQEQDTQQKTQGINNGKC